MIDAMYKKNNDILMNNNITVCTSMKHNIKIQDD